VGADTDQGANPIHLHQRDQIWPFRQPSGIPTAVCGDPCQLNAPGPLGEDVGHLARLTKAVSATRRVSLLR
jgi:hypothetical protein